MTTSPQPGETATRLRLDRTRGTGADAGAAPAGTHDLEALERGRKGLPRAWMAEAERLASVTRSVPLALAYFFGDFAIYLGFRGLDGVDSDHQGSARKASWGGAFDVLELGDLEVVGPSSAHGGAESVNLGPLVGPL